MLQEINLLQDIVSNLGFPIVMVAYFIWDKYKTMTPLIDAINNNTTVLRMLLTKIDKEEILVESGESHGE